MAISTNKEYLTTLLSRFNVSGDDVDLILLEAGLNGDNSPDVNACKTAVYNSLSVVLPMANVSEGGFSVSWNIDALKLWYNSLCRELGKPDVLKPAVRNRSNLW